MRKFLIIIAGIGLFMQSMAWAQNSSPVPGSTTSCPSNLCSASNSALSQYAAANNCSPGFLNPAGCNLNANTKANRVDIGFIRPNESIGGKINPVATVPHYKSGKVIGHSGVTIGAGIDLGQLKVSNLKSFGLSAGFINLVKPYLGLQGKPALTYLKAHPLTIPNKLISDLNKLQNAVEKKIINKVAANFTAASNPGLNFFQLPSGAQTAIADIAFQYGPNLNKSKNKAVKLFWNQITTGQWQVAVNNLNNFGDPYTNRRQAEANLIQSDITSGTLPSNQANCP